MPTLEEIGAAFRGADQATRIELLLDHARKLPPLPDRLREARDRGRGRVHECVTPVFLWVEPNDDGTVRLFIDAPEEAPTIRGIAGVLVRALDGAPREAYEALPKDLIATLGLEDVLRMNRRLGVAGLVGRIRRVLRRSGPSQGSVHSSPG